jgi:flavin reductase (DIM6/NTAB) family NADH-FMN oxidoreductase RutF
VAIGWRLGLDLSSANWTESVPDLDLAEMNDRRQGPRVEGSSQPQREAGTVDPQSFRNALGCFTTGVTVITAVAPSGELLGVTANSFNSVSLDPPLVLFSLHRAAYSLGAFTDGGRFAVNILGADQRELSMRFAKALGDKWSGVEYELWDTGAPILKGCLASFECRTRALYDGGDHVIFLGEVLRLRTGEVGRPLLYFRGRYRGLEEDPAG